MNYKLIAIDMDNTALNSKKELSDRSIKAMSAAISQGKHVVFSTGRGVSLVLDYMDMVPGMRYLISASGAEVLDVPGKKTLYKKSIDAETVKHILAEAAGGYCLPVIYMNGESYGDSWTVDSAADFHVGAFEPIYRKRMVILDDCFGYFMQNTQPVEKINFFYADADAPAVYEKIKDLPISITSYTPKSLEINASGISKAKGLEVLCTYLGISAAECIAVGDSMNDEELFRCAGLKVAMGNATDKLKSMADIITDDCENDGVAKIIEQYLLD